MICFITDMLSYVITVHMMRDLVIRFYIICLVKFNSLVLIVVVLVLIKNRISGKH